jgi:hypothetical protein
MIQSEMELKNLSDHFIENKKSHRFLVLKYMLLKNLFNLLLLYILKES